MCKEYELKPTIFQETLKLYTLLNEVQSDQPNIHTQFKDNVKGMLATWVRLQSSWHPKNQSTALFCYVGHLKTCFDLSDELSLSDDLNRVIAYKKQLSKIAAYTAQLAHASSSTPSHRPLPARL